MKKTVVVIFNDNDAALYAGSNVALRMAEVNKERKVELEVFLFGPGQNAYSGGDQEGPKANFKETIGKLIQAGIPVSACTNAAEANGSAEALRKDGLKLEFARDAFLRYAEEHAAVITF